MSRHPELALALLRLMLGAVFVQHGFGAIFVRGLGSLSAQFAAGRVPLPLLSAPLVATLELAGGLLLALGLGARPLALVLAALMGGASAYAARGHAFLTVPGPEWPLVLLACCLALALGGPGWPSFNGAGPRTGKPARRTRRAA